MSAQNNYENIHFQQLLPAEQWQERQERHKSRLSSLIDPYLGQRSRHLKNPILDFLFEYYHYRPTHLYKWSPGIGIGLEFEDPERLPPFSEMSFKKGIAWLNPDFFPENRIRSFQRIAEILKNSKDRNPLFGCFGMHEWAMVYRSADIRHEQLPLRLSESDIAAFVESRPIVCTHFDAFRFFTDPAKPLNKHQLTRDRITDMEQPGCIHTNMDLYKWAFKLYPWIPGELLADTFFNAVEARKIDMQASPYDLREFGLKPVKIETEAGRLEYLDKQKAVYQKSEPLRERLLEAYNRTLQRVAPEHLMADSC